MPGSKHKQDNFLLFQQMLNQYDSEENQQLLASIDNNQVSKFKVYKNDIVFAASN